MTTTNEKLDQQNREDLETAKSFESVFGEEGRRNPDQLKVWSVLKTVCCFETTTLRLANGVVDIPRSTANEGGRAVFLELLRQLKVAKAGIDPTTKPTVTKT